MKSLLNPAWSMRVSHGQSVRPFGRNCPAARTLAVPASIVWATLAGLLVLWLCDTASAQWQGTTTGRSGLFGSRTLGQTLSAGKRTFRGSGGLASGGLGTRAGAGAGQMVGGLVNPAARFIRGNRQPGDFVGSDSRDRGGFVGGRDDVNRTGDGMPSGPRQRDLSGRPRRRTGRFGGNDSTDQQQRTPVRTTIHVAFEYPQPVSDELSSALADRLNRLSVFRGRVPIEVSVQGDTAILWGEVASEHGRALAGQLARLEAGIWHVRNELVVTPSTATEVGPLAAPRPLDSQTSGEQDPAE